MSLRQCLVAGVLSLAVMSSHSQAEVVVGTYYGDPSFTSFTGNVVGFSSNLTPIAGQVVSTGSGGLVQAAGITYGPGGNLYVSSRGTNQVIEYNGTTGAPIASFPLPNSGAPAGLQFGPDGNLYVADGNGNAEQYNVTTHAWTAVTSGVGSASGIAFDASGNLYVSDLANNDIVKVSNPGTPGQVQTTFAAGIFTPGGMTFVPGAGGTQNMLVTEVFGAPGSGPGGSVLGNDILRLNSSGSVIDKFASIQPTPDGTALSGTNLTSPFYISNFPAGLVYDPSSHSVYVAVLGKDFNFSGSVLQYNLNDTTNSEATMIGLGAQGLPGPSSIALLQSVPEPSTLILAAIGLAAAIAFRRRRRVC